MQQIIIDVGGSGIQAYIKEENTKPSVIVDVEIPYKPSEIDEFIYSIYLELADRGLPTLLGIPGPVGSRDKSVYCPPLNTTLNLQIYRSQGVRIVNDTVANVLINWNEELSMTRAGLVVTIGTSLGLCTYNVDQNSDMAMIENFLSHEVAHEKCLDYSRQLQPLDGYIKERTLGGIFSIGGLVNIYGLKSIEIGNNLYRVSRENSKRLIPILTTSEKFSLWLKSLNQCIKQYLIENSLSDYYDWRYISGGLATIAKLDSGIADAIEESGFKLIKN